jgi:hypothetical protein
MQTYKRICVGCNKEFEAGSINGRYCKAPICRKMCKSGQRGIPEAVKQSVPVPEVVKPLKTVEPKKQLKTPDKTVRQEETIVRQKQTKELPKAVETKKIQAKVIEKKEPGIVILRIKGAEYIAGLSDSSAIWTPVKTVKEKPVETIEDSEEVVVKDKSEGRFDFEEHAGTNN